MSETVMQSPLIQSRWLSDSNALVQDAGVCLGERPFCSHINVRGRPQQSGFLQTLGDSVGAELPGECNRVVFAGQRMVFCLGPDEWLIVGEPGQESALGATVRNALGDHVAAVTEISSGQTIIQISGPQARALLAHGCPIDLHPGAFGKGQCAQTLLAKAGVLLWPISDESLELIVRRSFADYLWSWLKDAGAQYGLAIT